jgi:hypothetical protein
VCRVNGSDGDCKAQCFKCDNPAECAPVVVRAREFRIVYKNNSAPNYDHHTSDSRHTADNGGDNNGERVHLL